MKKVLGTIFTLLILIMSLIALNDTNTSNALETSRDIGTTSMYFWSLDDIDYSSLDKTIDYLNVDTIYVGSYSDLYSYNNTLLFNFAKEHNLTTYIVYGEKIASLKDVKKLTDQVVQYNNNSEFQITGLAIDSEFHTTDEYRSANSEGRKAMFRTYVDFMKEAYAYAKSNNLKYVSCIPVNYDNISEELLEELIRDGSDYTQLMNYNKNGKITKIEKEVEFAKKYNKPIESIAELLPPGHHDVTDSITFWNQGLDACTDSFREIDAYYNYDKMKFAYHYYNPVVELAANILDFTQDYNYELYTKDIDGNTMKIDDLYLVSGNERIKGITAYVKKSKEYVVYFYGVKYNQEYTLVVNGYEINNTKVSYVKDSDATKYDERTFKVSEKIPEEPVIPNEPVVPVVPVEPVVPVIPVVPSEPVIPEVPSEPSVPVIEEPEVPEPVMEEKPSEEVTPSKPPYTGVEISKNVEIIHPSLMLFMILLIFGTFMKSINIDIE